MLISNIQAQNTRTFLQNNYVLDNGNWNLIISDSLKFQVEKNVITLKYIDSISDTQRQNFENNHQLTFIREAPITHWVDYKVPDGTDIFNLAETLDSDSIVANIEIPTVAKPMSTPNDTYYNLQWYLNNPTAGIHIEDAWDIAGDCSEVIVGIVDTGVDTNHIDLSDNIYLNLAEANGQSGVDDDNNGYIDDINGWNAVNNNANIEPLYSNPNVNPDIMKHGTLVNGIIGAKQKNNEGIAGIGTYGIKLLNTSVLDNEGVVSGAAMDDALQYLYLNNVRLINMSLIAAFSASLNDTYDLLLANEIPVIMPRRPFSVNDLPPLHPVIIPISGSTEHNEVLLNSPNGEYDFSWVAAPGRNLYTTSISNAYTYTPNTVPHIGPMGTSFSAAIVSGVMALMYSQNQCLTIADAKEILKNTADKVGGYNYNYDTSNPGHSRELGYGKINAYQAVLAAKNSATQGLGFTYVWKHDLFIRDNGWDYGGEPSRYTNIDYYDDVDIWVRLQDDDGTTHQEPTAGDGPAVYVYVRVNNRSCRPTIKGHSLRLYWGKITTVQQMVWEDYWTGDVWNNGIQQGNQILTLSGYETHSIDFDEILSGESKIYKFKWHLNSLPFMAEETDPAQLPAEIRGPDNPYIPPVLNFALLARVTRDSDNFDPMYIPEGPNAFENRTNNNNISIRRIHVLEPSPRPNHPLSGIFPISNETDTPRTIDIQFRTPNAESGKLIFAEADTRFKIDNNLLSLWQDSGSGQQYTEFVDETEEFKLTSENAGLQNITLPPHSTYWARIDIYYLTKELTDKDRHHLLVDFSDSQTGKKLSTRTFLIKKPDATVFEAKADAVETEKNEPVTVQAEDIGEAAIYNWYDPQGNLIYTGKDLTVAPEITKTYKLEIIRNADGFKDTQEVEVKVKPDRIENISPNPADAVINIAYKAHNASSAYLIITGAQNNISQNYILDGSLESRQIDVSGYPAGYYGVALVCDGQIVDTQTFQKQ